MSALRPKAEVAIHGADVRYVPTPDVAMPVTVTLGDEALWSGETMHVGLGNMTMTLLVPVDAVVLGTAAESLAKSARSRL